MYIKNNITAVSQHRPCHKKELLGILKKMYGVSFETVLKCVDVEHRKIIFKLLKVLKDYPRVGYVLTQFYLIYKH